MSNTVKVQKLFGEFPDAVRVLDQVATFDEAGIADVSVEVADVLSQISHQYALVDASEAGRIAEAKEKADADDAEKKLAQEKADEEAAESLRLADEEAAKLLAGEDDEDDEDATDTTEVPAMPVTSEEAPVTPPVTDAPVTAPKRPTRTAPKA